MGGGPMTRLLSALVLGCACLGSVCAEETVTPDTLVWCGLDYSMVKMIGTNDFRQPSEIFPGKLEAWNDLFMKEMFHKLRDMAPEIKTDIKAVEAGNAALNADCIVHEDGTRD